MFFRTRDFILFILTIAFLLIAITATVSRDLSSDFIEPEYHFSETDEHTTYDAVLTESPPDERPSRLTALREKISQLGETQIIASKPVEENIVSEGEREDVVADIPGSIDYCEDYAKLTSVWVPNNLMFEVIEGARLIYRKVEGGVFVESSLDGSTTTPAINREVALQLPIRLVPVSIKSCITSDVVGVALDGSLIRNDEQGLYGIFGSETLLGYALDGFPIYGSGGVLQTDSCGGSAVSGEYRYYLSPEREGVLGCYSGVPVRL
jgi:hypothetical protein